MIWQHGKKTKIKMRFNISEKGVLSIGKLTTDLQATVFFFLVAGSGLRILKLIITLNEKK